MGTVLFREAAFATGKVVLNYAEDPAAGPPLVMLHGGSGRWQLYSGMLAELAGRCHVYAPEGSSTLREIFGEGSPVIHELAGRIKNLYAYNDSCTWLAR